MLLTLTASSLRPLLQPVRTGRSAALRLVDLPAYAREELGLHGLNLCTDLLAGAGRAELEAIRERADKARCSCLVLIEPAPQAVAEPSKDAGRSAVERISRVLRAAQVLGCNAAAIGFGGSDDRESFERAVERLKRCVAIAEGLELNLLISPMEGLTAQPERVTELIKKVGGFRLGTLPDFEAAAASSDPTGYLRRLTPYAAVVSATTYRFVPQGTGARDGSSAPVRHEPYELEPLVAAVMSVGYDGTLSICYRGGGDARLGVERSRDLLLRAMS